MIIPVNRKYNIENFKLANHSLQAVEAFPFFGTMLGLIREGSIIENDDDIDFYVDSINREISVSILQEIGFYINKEDKSVYNEHFIQGIREIDGINTYVDIYFYQNDVNKPWIVDKWNFLGAPEDIENFIHIDKDLIFPLIKKEFLGETVLVPKLPVACCELLYGKEWMTPVSKFNAEYKVVVIDNKPQILYPGDPAYKIMLQKDKVSIECNRLRSLIEVLETSYSLLSAKHDYFIWKYGKIRSDAMEALKQFQSFDEELVSPTINPYSTHYMKSNNEKANNVFPANLKNFKLLSPLGDFGFPILQHHGDTAGFILHPTGGGVPSIATLRDALDSKHSTVQVTVKLIHKESNPVSVAIEVLDISCGESLKFESCDIVWIDVHPGDEIILRKKMPEIDNNSRIFIFTKMLDARSIYAYAWIEFSSVAFF